MVVIQLKKGDELLLNHSAPSSTSILQLTSELATLNNDRKRLERLVGATKDLLAFGPEKSQDQRGYSEEQIDKLGGNTVQSKIPITKNGFIFYKVDCPLGVRVGLEAGDDAVRVVQPVLDAAEELISKKKALSNQLLLQSELKTCFENISGALTIVYPEGLPAWDSARLALEDKEDLKGTAASKEIFKPLETSLWWAGKELLGDKCLSDYVGKNEKTKIVVKIQKKGAGPPTREAPMSEAEQKNMMAYYYKKQEELKRLEENGDDDYLHSSWADPKSLKNAFNGMGNIRLGYK